MAVRSKAKKTPRSTRGARRRREDNRGSGDRGIRGGIICGMGGWGWRLIQHQRLGWVGLCESARVGLNHVINRSPSDPTYSGGGGLRTVRG